MQFVRRLGEGSTPVEQRFVDFKPTTREFQVLDMTRALPTGSYYWTLPREFLGERVSLIYKPQYWGVPGVRYDKGLTDRELLLDSSKGVLGRKSKFNLLDTS